jgi:hypothetical protein
MPPTVWLGNVIIYRNLAYVPTMHTLGVGGGGWYTGEPVTVVPVTVEDIARALAKARRAGNPPVTPLQVAVGADPILRSTGAQTWGRLAIYAASYEVTWGADDVKLVMSMLDERGRFAPDPAKLHHWPASVEILPLAEAIVADWNARMAAADARTQQAGDAPEAPAPGQGPPDAPA